MPQTATSMPMAQSGMRGDTYPEALRAAAAQLIPLLYDDLRRVARRERLRSRPGETLQTTALVNEAYLKLARAKEWNDRDHFLRAAALAMRQIIVDRARAQLRQKRGGGLGAISLDDAPEVADETWPMESEDEIVELDEALDRLAQLNPRLAELVQCRFFAGYTEEQAAQALGLSERTLRRDWIKAKAWLYRELKGLPAEETGPE